MSHLFILMIRMKYKDHIYKEVIVNLLAIISVKKETSEVDLILTSLNNTNRSLNKDDAYYLSCYLFR